MHAHFDSITALHWSAVMNGLASVPIITLFAAARFTAGRPQMTSSVRADRPVFVRWWNCQCVDASNFARVVDVFAAHAKVCEATFFTSARVAGPV